MSERVRPLTAKLRKAILERDNFTSQIRTYTEEDGWTNRGYCEDDSTCAHLEVHHISPRGQGGGNVPENLITLFKCQHVGYCPSGRALVRRP